MPPAPARTVGSRKSANAAPVEGITHPDKVFWPDDGYTKVDLARFYQSVFPKLRPYVQDHLLTLERCPDGMQGECFYQKEKPKGMPPGTPTKAIRHKTGITHYVVGGSLETQLALVNLGCIAVHAMASTAESPRQPQWICFDLDPESGKFWDAAQAALWVKEVLDALRLTSFAKTSGSRGMHVFVPLRKGPDASDVLAFAREFCDRVAAAHPRELTVEHSIEARHGRVYLDPFRNAFGQTVVAPFSVRRRARAPVSTPLAWNEVKPGLDPAGFHIGGFGERLRRSDPWADFFRARQSITSATKSIAKI